jgi:mannitol-1-phosphate/altronate dehydrogenase
VSRGLRLRAIGADRAVIAVQRFEVRADVDPREVERRVDRSLLQLVTVMLTDAGAVIDEDGRERRRPDVVVHLRPSEATELARRLLALAEHAERLTGK